MVSMGNSYRKIVVAMKIGIVLIYIICVQKLL